MRRLTGQQKPPIPQKQIRPSRQAVRGPPAYKAQQSGKSGIFGGEGGIRTPGTVARTSHFECDAFDHSATSPGVGAEAPLVEPGCNMPAGRLQASRQRQETAAPLTRLPVCCLHRRAPACPALPCGGIGRRARLKIEFRKECWFDPGQGHQFLKFSSCLSIS